MNDGFSKYKLILMKIDWFLHVFRPYKSKVPMKIMLYFSLKKHWVLQGHQPQLLASILTVFQNNWLDDSNMICLNWL